MALDYVGDLPKKIIGSNTELILAYIHDLLKGGAISTPAPAPVATAAAACDENRTYGLQSTPVEIKGSAGNLYGISIHNNNAYQVFVKIVDETAAGTTVGTTPIVRTIRIPLRGSFVLDPKEVPWLHCSTAITMYCVRYYQDTDTTNVPANTVIVEAQYK
jgi:hypothetical protein